MEKSGRLFGGIIVMKTRSSRMLVALILAAPIGLAGCGSNRFLTPPGPLNQQQARAVIHDPYPQNDIGPFEAASRPPDYQTPLPEPVRNRISRDAFLSRPGN